MNKKTEWDNVLVELQGIWSDLNRIQCKIYTDCMKVKNTMHELKELIDYVKAQQKEGAK